MILDSTLEFCDALDVSASTGTAQVGDEIDLDTIGRRIGSGQNISLYVNVSAAFTSGTASTVQFQLVSDAQEAIATDGTATIHWASEIFADSELPAGSMIHVRLPGGLPNAERYLALLVVTGAAATTAGSINAGLLLDAQDWTSLPDGAN